MPQDADTPATDAARGLPRVQLDAYPRLCGLPVTFERLLPTTSIPPQPSGRSEPPSSCRRP
jgi:hypothetical protein